MTLLNAFTLAGHAPPPGGPIWAGPHPTLRANWYSMAEDGSILQFDPDRGWAAMTSGEPIFIDLSDLPAVCAVDALPDAIRKGVSARHRVTLAPQDRIKLRPRAVGIVLAILGHPEALVTDESSVRDFYPDEQTMRRLADRSGMEVTGETLIADVAQAMHEAWGEKDDAEH